MKLFSGELTIMEKQNCQREVGMDFIMRLIFVFEKMKY